MSRSPPRAAYLRCAHCLLWLAIASSSFAAEPPPTLAAARPAQRTEADLEATWESCRSALSNQRWNEVEVLLSKLVDVKEDLGIAELDAHSLEVIGAAKELISQGNTSLALRFAERATQLAPHLPLSHAVLARAHFAESPSDLSVYLPEVQRALHEWWSDPRSFRSGLADVGASLLFALLGTVLVVLALLSSRCWRFFLHDFHHLFPRGAGRWETSLLAVVVLALPVVFRLGLVPLLLMGLAAGALYLSTKERCLLGALVASLGLFPCLAGTLASRASFSGTPAEDVYQLVRGGLGAAVAEARAIKRADEDRSGFAELFALGQYQLHQGKVEQALRYLGQAALKRGDDGRILTALGNAMFAKGDLEGAADAYLRAGQLDPTAPAPTLNLARLYEMRASLAKPAGEDSSKATVEQPSAAAASSRIGRTYVNRMLVSPELSSAEISSLADSPECESGIQKQLSLTLTGNVESPLAWLYPLLASALLVAAGFVSSALAVSTPCEKCGQPVCQRCDPRVVSGGMLCGQCVTVFARSKDVTPDFRMRKQLELARHHLRLDKIAYALSFACSGAGHLFTGAPLRGAAYVFAFLFGVSRMLFHRGVVRLPYSVEPSWIGLLPVAVLLIFVHLVSIRGLYRLRS